MYKRLIELCTDICRRNGKTKLLWLGDKTKTLNYTPKSDEMVLTVHRWFANKEYAKIDTIIANKYGISSCSIFR